MRLDETVRDQRTVTRGDTRSLSHGAARGGESKLQPGFHLQRIQGGQTGQGGWAKGVGLRCGIPWVAPALAALPVAG